MIRIRKLESQNFRNTEREWDDFVGRHPAGSFYHFAGWRTIFEEVFGHQSIYLYAEDDHGNIVGVLPAVLMRNILGRRFLVSLPYLSYGGLLADSVDAERALITAAEKYLTRFEVQYLELRQKNRAKLPQIVNDAYVNPMLPLDPDPDKIWMSSLNAKVRNQVRQFARRGGNLEYGLQNLDQFYRIFSITMHRLGTPTHPASLFTQLVNVFGDRVILLLARVNGIPVASMLLLDFNGRILSNPWTASLADFQWHRPNNGIYWEAIRFACKSGFQLFDFGRSPIGAGTYHFKRQWGAEPIPLYYQYVFGKARSYPLLNGDENKYASAIKLWKKMPLGLATSAGKRLTKYLPEL